LDLTTYLRKEHITIQKGYTPVTIYASPEYGAIMGKMFLISHIALIMVFVCAYGGIFVALWLNRKKTMSSKRILTRTKELI
jgi:hypothetical protein